MNVASSVVVGRFSVKEKTVARSDLSLWVLDMYLAAVGCRIIICPPTRRVIEMSLLVLGIVLANSTVDWSMADIIRLLYDLLDSATFCVSRSAMMVGCGSVRCNSIPCSLIDVRP